MLVWREISQWSYMHKNENNRLLLGVAGTGQPWSGWEDVALTQCVPQVCRHPAALSSPRTQQSHSQSRGRTEARLEREWSQVELSSEHRCPWPESSRGASCCWETLGQSVILQGECNSCSPEVNTCARVSWASRCICQSTHASSSSSSICACGCIAPA